MAIRMEKLVLRNRRLLWMLVKRDLKMRYAGSIIGIFWSVINPLIMLAIYVTVIGFILGGGRFGESNYQGQESFAIYLCCGFLPWNCVSEALMGSANSIAGNASLLKKAVFPMAVLPFQAIASAFVNFFISFGLFLVILCGIDFGLDRNYLNHKGLLLPLLMLLQFFFLVGPALIFATINVFFRDTIQLLNSFLMIGFWITPIIYDHEQEALREHVPQGLLTTLDYWMAINPFAHLLSLYQDIFFKNQWPALHSVIYLLILGAALYVIGKYLFTRSQVHFVDDI